MIVVHFPSWFPFAGRPHNGNFILRQIEAAGAHTTAIVLHHINDDFDTEALSSYSNIIFYPIKVPKDISKTRLFSAYCTTAFQNIVRQYGKPDLIHLHVALPLGPIAAFLSRKYNIPLVVSEHWSIYKPINWSSIRLAQKIMMRFTFRTARGITTVSEDLHNTIVNTYPFTNRIPFFHISNVVNTKIFKTSSQVRTFEKKQILHISTLDNNAKNIMGILSAIKELSEIRKDFILNIIHDLSNEDVENYISKNHLEDFVHLLGEKSEEEVAQHIQESDFILMFSNYENQPCVLLEAFCCGKPAITTPVGGIPEVANSQNAVFVEPRNENQLVEKLNFLLDNRTAFEESGISQSARERFSPETIGQLFYSAYQKTLQK